MNTLTAPENATLGQVGHFRNLLVAIDPLCETQHLLSLAASVARRYGSEVSLVHVIPEESLEIGVPATRVAARADSENVIRQCADLMKLRGHHCKTYVKVGDIVTEVQKLVRSKHIDLVIVGSSGIRGLRKLRVGSVAEGLLRTLECPVLTVGPDVPSVVGGFYLHKLLFPCALDSPVEDACSLVETLAGPESHVVVLHALPSGRRFSQSAPAMVERHQARMEREFPCQGKAFTADYVVKFGTATEVILDLAHTWEADLIVLPARRSGSFASHLPGHIAYEVIRKAPCPVLTLRV
jgi:nucleotide-binding universal stress UspA family protein